MEFCKLKPKKNMIPKEKLVSSLKNEKELIGVFNGQYVTICDLDSANYLYKMGSFGKGSLSKGNPKYHSKKSDIPKIMLQHQFENQLRWNTNKHYSSVQNCLESDSDSIKLSVQSTDDFLQSSFFENGQNLWKNFKENCKQESENLKKKFDASLLDFKTEVDYKDENFISFVNTILQSRQLRRQKTLNLIAEEIIVLNTSFSSHATDLSLDSESVRLEKLPFSSKENLNLSLEESFFLKSVMGCLNIVDLNFSEIQIPNLWEEFNVIDKNFTERYIIYHYLKTKGWIVKSGLKFGGDYLLYKDGPAYYHASYLVKVLSKKKKLMWKEFIAMNRLVETFNKSFFRNLLNVSKISGNVAWKAFSRKELGEKAISLTINDMHLHARLLQKLVDSCSYFPIARYSFRMFENVNITLMKKLNIIYRRVGRLIQWFVLPDFAELLKLGGHYLSDPSDQMKKYLETIESASLKKNYLPKIRTLSQTEDLLLTYVVPDNTASHEESFPEVLRNQSVQEIIVKRWFPSKERLSEEDKTCN